MRLTIRNFQKHRKLVMELPPGVTSITGDTDRGKSAILRALIWVLTNQPSGAKFISHGEKGASVTLEWGDNWLKRSRGAGGINKYVLNGKTFVAFGEKVPEEISQLLNITDLNIQQQHDRSFWFHISPSEAARRLNAIIDLSLIDDAQASASARTKKANNALEFIKQRKVDAAAELDRLAYVPDFAAEVAELEELQRKLDLKQNQIEDLAHALEELETLQSIIRDKLELPDFTTIDELIRAYNKSDGRVCDLAEVVTEAESMIEQRDYFDSEISKIEQEMKSYKPRLCKTCGQPLPI